MRVRLVTAVAALRRPALFRTLLFALFTLVAAIGSARADPGPVETIVRAFVVNSSGDSFPAEQAAVPVTLPDDWSQTRPRYDGNVWYRTRFDLPRDSAENDLLALYIERACSNVEVHLNDRRIFSGGRMIEPVAANCLEPQLVALPAALLRPAGNVIDIRVAGHALQHVASREFAGGLSALRIGPQAALAAEYARHRFWNITWVQITGAMLVVLGALMLTLAWQNPHEVYFGYFGGFAIGWAALSMRLWLHELPWDHAATDYAYCLGLATLVGLAVQFLLSYAGLRSRAIESALVLQWLLVPLTLMLGGETRLFAVANLWYVLFSAEMFAMGGLYLGVTWRERRHDFWPMFGVFGVAALLLMLELGTQHELFATLPFALPYAPLPILMPFLFFFVGMRLFLMFARALRTSEAARTALGRRVHELTTEFEGNFSQLAELRVEQVTERERKRIAADLHDDLGAKLLTIVHTSESERITVLAREALEDMRLSVKGLIGKPMRLADALADWRAETIARLGQAQIEAHWQNPTEETEHLLPSRGFVQTTRIVREAVSNIVKHSRATHCDVRCSIADGNFTMTIRDNGRGIPMELDGKLDRGLGMSSMKRRAKQMQGQCLVQSGPGYGTVIALTVPL